MMNFFTNEELGLGIRNFSPDNPSNLLPLEIKKMALGTLSNRGRGILYNGNPIDGIQGAVIVNDQPFLISDDVREQWEFEFDDSGNISFGLYIGKEYRKFSSSKEDNMQIFLNYGFAGREVLIVLDTRINKQGTIVNKGPIGAEQMETLFSILIQYFAANKQRDAANNDNSLPPQSNPRKTQNTVCDGGGVNDT